MRGVMSILPVLMLTGQVWVVIDTRQPKDEVQEQTFCEITPQLCCPKRQSNSIADSSTMVAVDIWQKMYELMQQGKTKRQIADYVIARYDYFVSYESPPTVDMVLLWLGPGLLVLAGTEVIIAHARRRDTPDAALNAEECQCLAALLKEGRER